MPPNSHSTDQGSGAQASCREHRPGGPPQGLVADPRHNRLLASLPEADRQRWRGHLKPVAMPLVQALIAQMAQITACNRYHTVGQQLCRWLLLSLDRLPGDQLVVTQQLIANMLDVRREGVTEAAAALQHAGLISYRRCHITVLDRPELEKRSCERYAVIKAEYNRLTPPVGRVGSIVATLCVTTCTAVRGPGAAQREAERDHGRQRQD